MKFTVYFVPQRKSTLCLPVIAQGANLITLRLLAFPKTDDTSPVELLLGDNTIELELASNRLSDPYKVPAQAEWSFGKTTEGTGKERELSMARGNPMKLPVASSGVSKISQI